jgi:hypothetical protein
MSALNFGTTVSLAEAASLIINCPNNRFFLQGEPGIGKSSIMGTLERHFGDAYAYAYFDCAQADLGDIAMPSINRDQQITEYFANAIFQLQSGKPVIIMLDEFTKAPQPVQNMLHPMLEARNPRLGNIRATRRFDGVHDGQHVRRRSWRYSQATYTQSRNYSYGAQARRRPVVGMGCD